MVAEEEVQLVAAVAQLVMAALVVGQAEEKSAVWAQVVLPARQGLLAVAAVQQAHMDVPQWLEHGEGEASALAEAVALLVFQVRLTLWQGHSCPMPLVFFLSHRRPWPPLIHSKNYSYITISRKRDNMHSFLL